MRTELIIEHGQANMKHVLLDFIVATFSLNENPS